VLARHLGSRRTQCRRDTSLLVLEVMSLPFGEKTMIFKLAWPRHRRARCAVPIVLAIVVSLTATGLALAEVKGSNSSMVAAVSTPIQALAVDSKDARIVFAGTDASNAPTDTGHGVFKSVNGGAAWVAAGLRAENVLALALDPRSAGTVYAGTQDDGVLKSTNGGASWRQMHLPSGKYSTPRSDGIAINPRNPRVVYASTTLGIFRSADGGASWRNVQPDGYKEFVVIDPLHTQIIYAAAYDYSLFKSTNDGASWRSVDVDGGADIDALVVDPKHPAILYAGTNTADESDPNSGGVFKSTDTGLTWRKVGLLHHDVIELAVDPLTPEIVYAATAGGLFKSTSGGSVWTRAGFEDQEIDALAFDPCRPKTVYAGTENAVFKSTNGGGSWTRASRGLLNH